MVETASLVIKYGFEKEALKKIFGRAYSQNRASCKIFEKLGFALEGRLKKHTYRWVVTFDTNMYGLLKEDFEVKKSN